MLALLAIVLSRQKRLLLSRSFTFVTYALRLLPAHDILSALVSSDSLQVTFPQPSNS